MYGARKRVVILRERIMEKWKRMCHKNVQQRAELLAGNIRNSEPDIQFELKALTHYK
jgi:hypothetical protein